MGESLKHIYTYTVIIIYEIACATNQKAKDVIRLLRGKDCLPVISTSAASNGLSETEHGSFENMCFAQPSKVVLGSSMDMEYISPEFLGKYLQRSYLDTVPHDSIAFLVLTPIYLCVYVNI
jgi:hypothetical protein